MKKAVYIKEDSGRELPNGLFLVPGKDYEVVDGEVGYGEGVFKIAAPLAERLEKSKAIKIFTSREIVADEPKPIVPAEAPPKAEKK